MNQKRNNNLKRNLIITQTSIYVFIVLHSISWHVFGLHFLPKLCPSGFGNSLGKLELNFNVLFWSLVFISTLFVNRAFCAWGCMFGAYQDFITRLFKKLKIKQTKKNTGLWVLGIIIIVYSVPSILMRKEYSWPTVFWFFVIISIAGFFIWKITEKEITTKNIFKLSKYIHLVQYLGLIVSMWISLNVFQKGIYFAIGDEGVLNKYMSVNGIIIAIITLALVAWGSVVERRFFCKYICPYGMLLKLTSRIPFLVKYKVISTENACNKCGKCNQECLMVLKPMDEILKFGEVKNPECINCLQCVAVCPKKAINFKTK
jgi:polyferredoxin